MYLEVSAFHLHDIIPFLSLAVFLGGLLEAEKLYIFSSYEFSILICSTPMAKRAQEA